MGTGAGGNFGNTKGKRINAKIHQGRQDTGFFGGTLIQHKTHPKSV